MDNKLDELERLKEKCVDYERCLNNVNRENAKYKQDILDLQDKLKKLEDDYNSLFNSIESEDEDESSYKTKSPFYEFLNDVRDEPKLMASIYLSKKDFFSPYEYKMYNLLENLLNDYRDELGDLAVFSKVRLADIVNLFEENYNVEEHSFCDSLEKNPNKKSVCELADRYVSNFNNNDYKRAFLFPLIRSHIDFLICSHNEEGKSNPILAIEVHGTEHDENSANPDWKRIYNDCFKIALFNPQNNAMKVRLLIVKNRELNYKEKLRDKIYTSIKLCLDCENIIEFVKGKKWNNTIYNDPKRIYVNKKEILLTDDQTDALESIGATLLKSKGNVRHYEYKGAKFVELGKTPTSFELLNKKFADRLMAELDKAGIKYQAKCAYNRTVISVAASDKQMFDEIREALTNRLKNDKDKQTQS